MDLTFNLLIYILALLQYFVNFVVLIISNLFFMLKVLFIFSKASNYAHFIYFLFANAGGKRLIFIFGYPLFYVAYIDASSDTSTFFGSSFFI